MYLEWKDCASVLIAVLCSCFRPPQSHLCIPYCMRGTVATVLPFTEAFTSAIMMGVTLPVL